MSKNVKIFLVVLYNFGVVSCFADTIKYDVAIIGSGPAGMTAGIYSSRAQFKTIILEGLLPGGQITNSRKVENWPGDISIEGDDLMERIRDHVTACGGEFRQDPVVAVDFSKTPLFLRCKSGTVIEARSVIIATGSHHRELDVPGEEEYLGSGVFTCVTCDGPFYQDKDVVIVGGGNAAVMEAYHLLKIVKTLTVVQNLSELSADDPIKFKVLEHKNANFIYNSIVKEIKGDGNKVTEVVIENLKDKTITTLPTSSIFVFIGFSPVTSLFKGHLDMDEYRRLKVTDTTKTSVEGVFIAGNVADFRYRQALTAAASGCMAALDAQDYLAAHEE